MILVAIPALVLAAASIAAFAGGLVWWLDVLANFRAQYVVALVVLGTVLLLSPRWRRYGYVVLAAAVVNLAVVAPLYLGSPGTASGGVPPIRVVSFNLLSTNEEYNEVIEYIRSTDADLVLLHEASRPWEVALESAGLDYEIIRARSEDLIFGTLVLARDEIEATSFGFAATEPRAIDMDYRPDGWPVSLQILSVHPLAPTNEERAGLRNAQTGFAREWAVEQEGPRVVVGDFNSTPWSAPFRDLVRGADLSNSQIGYGLQPSFPADSLPLLRVPIDHLVHGSDIVVIDRRLGPSMGSDHFPLIVDLTYSP